VEVLPALLAKVLIRAGGFVHDANTATVLPDLANVALNEQTARILALAVRIRQ
jgi:hypothetical protein